MHRFIRKNLPSYTTGCNVNAIIKITINGTAVVLKSDDNILSKLPVAPSSTTELLDLAFSDQILTAFIFFPYFFHRWEASVHARCDGWGEERHRGWRAWSGWCGHVTYSPSKHPARNMNNNGWFDWFYNIFFEYVYIYCCLYACFSGSLVMHWLIRQEYISVQPLLVNECQEFQLFSCVALPKNCVQPWLCLSL